MPRGHYRDLKGYTHHVLRDIQMQTLFKTNAGNNVCRKELLGALNPLKVCFLVFSDLGTHGSLLSRLIQAQSQGMLAAVLELSV